MLIVVFRTETCYNLYIIVKSNELRTFDMKKYPIEEKTIEELIQEVNEALQDVTEMTEEEEIEDDAEGGYFQDEDD